MVHVGVGITPDAVLGAVFYPRIGQYVLEAGARHCASRERVALNDNRLLRQDRLDIQRLEFATIEHAAEIGEAPVRIAANTVTEIVLASGVKVQILLHLPTTRFQKADKPSPMIEMPMAED